MLTKPKTFWITEIKIKLILEVKLKKLKRIGLNWSGKIAKTENYKKKN